MLKIVGDISLTDGYFDVGFGVGSKLAIGFNPFSRLERTDSDCWVGNFEGVASKVTNKTGMASKYFRVEPERLKHFQHFDVYGLANNHAMQHGEDAFNETARTLTALGAKVCLGGAILEHQGRKVSISALSQRIDQWSENPMYWHNPEYTEIEEEIAKLPSDAYKILFVHWGNEFINYPSSQQKKFAHWLINSGFDLIVGMHPHILQGYEQYKGKYIFYSIGNFVFDMAWEPTRYGAIVNVDFLDGNNVRIAAEYIQIGEDNAPVVVPERDVPESYRFKTLNELIAIEENSEEYHAAINRYYRQYRKANHKDIMKKMLRHPSCAVNLINDFIKRRL